VCVCVCTRVGEILRACVCRYFLVVFFGNFFLPFFNPWLNQKKKEE